MNQTTSLNGLKKMAQNTLTELIHRKIRESLPDSQIFVDNPGNDGAHFEAVVVSSSFENMTMVRQHQMVFKALENELKQEIHALALKTFTPGKWQAHKEEN